jgi:hypothetical protein
LLQWVVTSAISIVAFWPLAEREMHGPFLATHVIIPVAIASVALLLFRLLRSLVVAVLCGLLAAAIVVLLLRHFGDQIRPLLEKALP